MCDNQTRNISRWSNRVPITLGGRHVVLDRVVPCCDALVELLGLKLLMDAETNRKLRGKVSHR